MSTTDQELPWALKIMMISLVTVAVFIYRKPFQHLFSSVGYGMLGANERAEVCWRESAFGFRRVTATAAGTVVPGAGARLRASRAGRGAGRTDAGGGGRRDRGGRRRSRRPRHLPGRDVRRAHGRQPRAGRQWPEAGVGTGRTAPPLPLPTQRRRPTAERRPGGLGQERWRGRRAPGRAGRRSRRSARPGRCRASPRHRRDPTPRRLDPARTGAARPTRTAPTRHDVDAAGGRSDDAARDAVLVAVPPPAQVAGPVMELTPGRQRLLFVVVVIALVGLGIFVIQGRDHRNTAAPRRVPDAVRERADRERGGGRDADRRAVARRLARRRVPVRLDGRREHLPVAAVHPVGPGRRGRDDASRSPRSTPPSYTESKAAYAGKLAGLATTQEAATLVSDFETAGVSTTRAADKQVSTGTGDDRLDQLVRPGAAGAAGPSVDHVRGHHHPEARLDARGRLAAHRSTPSRSSPPATGWQVEDIQLASLGNQ